MGKSQAPLLVNLQGYGGHLATYANGGTALHPTVRLRQGIRTWKPQTVMSRTAGGVKTLMITTTQGVHTATVSRRKIQQRNGYDKATDSGLPTDSRLWIREEKISRCGNFVTLVILSAANYGSSSSTRSSMC